MPTDPVPRILEYVGLLLLLTTASTFAWWGAASIVKPEYHKLLSALACSMRWFFYSVCLLAILIALRTMNLEPQDPRSRLFSWVHIGGTVWISIPCAWRAFRQRGPKLVAVLALGWLFCAAVGAALWFGLDGLQPKLAQMPDYMVRAS